MQIVLVSGSITTTVVVAAAIAELFALETSAFRPLLAILPQLYVLGVLVSRLYLLFCCS